MRRTHHTKILVIYSTCHTVCYKHKLHETRKADRRSSLVLCQINNIQFKCILTYRPPRRYVHRNRRLVGKTFISWKLNNNNNASCAGNLCSYFSGNQIPDYYYIRSRVISYVKCWNSVRLTERHKRSALKKIYLWSPRLEQQLWCIFTQGQILVRGEICKMCFL